MTRGWIDKGEAAEMKFLAKRAGAEVGSSCRDRVVLRVGLFKDGVAGRKGIRTTVGVNTGTDDVGDRACVDQEQRATCGTCVEFFIAIVGRKT
jgi:hypothetical protein